jgi:WD40 repeat protein
MPRGVTLEGLKFSPNRRLLARMAKRDSGSIMKIWVITTDGEVQAELKVEGFWTDFTWINDEQIGLQLDRTDWDGTMQVIHIRTGETVKLVPPFEDIYRGEFEVHWKIKYSPDLKWLAYEDGNEDIKLYDLEKKRVLWTAEGLYGYITVSWHPSGDLVAVYDWEGREIYLIQRDGAVQLFPYPSALERPEKPDASFGGGVEGFEWSPDGRYLASWAFQKYNNPDRLLIYDTEEKKLMDFCIDSVYAGIVLWAPDSRQLLIDTRYSREFETYTQVIYLNLLDGRNYDVTSVLPNEALPYDWFQ